MERSQGDARIIVRRRTALAAIVLLHERADYPLQLFSLPRDREYLEPFPLKPKPPAAGETVGRPSTRVSGRILSECDDVQNGRLYMGGPAFWQRDSWFGRHRKVSQGELRNLR